jgi:hypothetical protein
MKSLTVCALVSMITMSLGGLVFAQEEKPDASLTLSKGQVAVGIGWSWGGGVLSFKGKKYPFKVGGLSVVDVGVTKGDAVGKVYHLKRLKDFNGTYTGAAAEGTIGGGAGISTMKNQNGVVIKLQSTTQGVNFKLAGEGVKITLK